MISAENSKMLAIKKQIAISNNDFDIVKKIENIKDDDDIDEEIINYSKND